jgi:hypothetical protein
MTLIYLEFGDVVFIKANAFNLPLLPTVAYFIFAFLTAFCTYSGFTPPLFLDAFPVRGTTIFTIDLLFIDFCIALLTVRLLLDGRVLTILFFVTLYFGGAGKKQGLIPIRDDVLPLLLYIHLVAGHI